MRVKNGGGPIHINGVHQLNDLQIDLYLYLYLCLLSLHYSVIPATYWLNRCVGVAEPARGKTVWMTLIGRH